MIGVINLCVLAWVGMLPTVQPQQPSLFAIPGERTERALVCAVSIEPCDRPTLAPLSPMLGQLEGVFAALSVKELGAIAACQTLKGPPPERIPDALPVASIVIVGSRTTRTVKIFEGSDGSMFGETVGEPQEPTPTPAGMEVSPSPTGPVPSRRAKLDRARLLGVASNQGWLWPLTAPPMSVTQTPTSAEPQDIGLEAPFHHGQYVVDKALIVQRIIGPRATTIPRADRVLNAEHFTLRTPKVWSPRTPAGLVVWIDATSTPPPAGGTAPAAATIPEALHAALDELNLIAIAPHACGNDRPIANRLQLALDAVATARARFPIDSTRIYISGISGGGRVASILQGCFPDVFRGTIAIVGISNYRDVPTPRGGAFAASYLQPRGEHWSQFLAGRVAAISGERDFNFLEITTSIQLLTADGVQARLFSDASTGHQMPTAERFAEAMRWVDEPARESFAGLSEQGESLLKAYMAKWRHQPATTAAQRAELVRITADAPWSPAAWKAVELLTADAAKPPSATAIETR